MKKVMIFFTFILGTFIFINSSAQTNPPPGVPVWVTIDIPDIPCSFDMPETPYSFDTLLTSLYSVAIDTTLALQVHVFDDARFDSINDIFQQALVQENNDTLRAMGAIMLLATNSELTSISDIQTDGYDGLEISFEYLSLASNYDYHSFVRFYLVDNYFVSFTVTVYEGSIDQGLFYKSLFFSSIGFL